MIDLTAIKFYDPGDCTPCRWTVYQLEREKASGTLYWVIVRDYLNLSNKGDKELVLKEHPGSIELNQYLKEKHLLGYWSCGYSRKFVVKFEESQLTKGATH